MVFIEVLNYLLLFTAGGLTGYYFLISLLALRTKSNIDYESIKIRKFAVVLFTHGKGVVLSRSLYSISGLVYPKNKYDIIVIAESYSENIVQTAKKMGAKILVPPKNIQVAKNKNILPWAFNRLLQSDAQYDAIVSFDADGLVSGNYLQVMNYYLEQGGEVIQGSLNNLRSPRGWVDKIREIDFLINGLVYPLGRKALKMGVNLRSNGICFSMVLLREFPWKIEKQPSMLEYGLNLRLNGIEIDFAPPAVIFRNALPSDTINSSYFNNQYVRNYQLIRKYVPQLISKGLKKKSFTYFDIIIELVSPKFGSLMIFVVAMGVINGVIWGLGWVTLSTLLLWLSVISIGIAGLPIAITVTDTEERLLGSILYIPINIYLKIQALLKKAQKAEQLVERSTENLVRVPDENQPV